MSPALAAKPRRGKPVFRPIPRLGDTQRAILNVLVKRKSATAVDLRDKIGKSADDHGTRATHAVLSRLVEAGYVERSGKLGDGLGPKGSVVTFSITDAGREARKAKA